MITLKTNPTGIDRHLQQLQRFLYSGALQLWGLQEADYNCYGRAYRNQREADFHPEVYIGNGQYKDAYLDSAVAATSFFHVGERQTLQSGYNNATVAAILFVNLDKIKPTATDRADEAAHVDIERILRKNMYGSVFTEIVTGIDKVFAEFAGWRKDESIRHKDMQPFHCFRANLTLRYLADACF